MKAKHAFYWIIAIGILTFGVFYFGWEEVLTTLKKADPLITGGLILLKLVTLFLVAYRWQYLLKKSNQNISLHLAMLINLGGTFVEGVTPSARLGGEATKIYLFHRHTSLSYSNLAGVLLTLKYFSLMPFLVIVITAFVLGFLRYPLPYTFFLALLFLILFFITLALIHHLGGKNEIIEESAGVEQTSKTEAEERTIPKGLLHRILYFIQNKVSALINFIHRSSVHSRSIVNTSERINLIIVSTLIWLLYPLKVYIVTYMLGFNIDIITVFIIAFTSYLVSLLPLLPGGLGLYEGSMLFMFSIAGYSPAEGLAVALLSRLIIYWFPLLLSAFATAYLAISHNNKSIVKNNP